MRKALMDFSCEALPDALPVLRDHGLVVLGSLAPERPETVRLVIGETALGLLPAECSGGLRLVKAQFNRTSYGSQRLVKVASFWVEGEHEQRAA